MDHFLQSKISFFFWKNGFPKVSAIVKSYYEKISDDTKIPSIDIKGLPTYTALIRFFMKVTGL